MCLQQMNSLSELYVSMKVSIDHSESSGAWVDKGHGRWISLHWWVDYNNLRANLKQITWKHEWIYGVGQDIEDICVEEQALKRW